MKDCDSDNDRSPFCRPGRPPSVARVRQAATVPTDHAYAANRSRRLRYVGSPAPGAPHINPAIEKTLTQRINQCNKENQKLKNLLLVNLDLVQQQSDRILSKDKVLADLKKENATLNLQILTNNVEEDPAPPPEPNVRRPGYQDPPPPVPIPAILIGIQLGADQPTGVHVSTATSTMQQLPLVPGPVQALEYNNLVIANPPLQECKEEEAEELHLPEDDQQDGLPNSFFGREGGGYDLCNWIEGCDANDLTKSSGLMFANDELLLPNMDIESTENSDYGLKENSKSSLETEEAGANQLKVTNLGENFKPIGDGNAPTANSEHPKLSRVTPAQSMLSGDTATSSRLELAAPPARQPAKSYLEAALSTRTPPMTRQHLAVSQSPTATVTSQPSPRTIPPRIQSRHRRPVAKPTENVGPPARKSETVSSYTQFYRSRNTHRLPHTVTSVEQTNQASTLDDTRSVMYTGSLSNRLKLMDAPPRGQDPYMLCDADTRDQSPIQKFHHTKAKDNYASRANVYHSSYSSDESDAKKVKSEPYEMDDRSESRVLKTDDSSDDDGAANEQQAPIPPHSIPLPPIDLKLPYQRSISDFSYGESQNIPVRNNVFDDDYSLPPMGPCSPSDYLVHPPPGEKPPADTIHPIAASTGYCQPRPLSTGATVAAKRKSGGSASTAAHRRRGQASGSSGAASTSAERAVEGGKWAAHQCQVSSSGPSSSSPTSSGPTSSGPTSSGPTSSSPTSSGPASSGAASSGPASSNPASDRNKPNKPKRSSRSRNQSRKKKSTVPAEPARSYSPISSPQFHTTLGEANSSWMISPAQLDAAVSHSRQQNQQQVEVPRWRVVSLGATEPPVWSGSEEIEEDLSDSAFEKRHLKLELTEKRQKRWDQQRLREQELVERLRLRQPDAPWYKRPNVHVPPEPHSLLPEPLNSIQYIELIGHNHPLPVSAFGDNILRIPERDFYLPWIVSTKPKKKRTKKIKLELSPENEGQLNGNVMNNEGQLNCNAMNNEGQLNCIVMNNEGQLNCNVVNNEGQLNCNVMNNEGPMNNNVMNNE